jgi:purine-nucleoside phosphorylase
MSIHIAAKPGEIASNILLPGDPLRAKFIAETFLDDPHCFSEVRGMLGFTGTYQGKEVSVMGTGMGIPSHSIYVTELIRDYQVKNLIRVGTCGALQPDLHVGDVLLAMTASTDSAINHLHFSGRDFAPAASFDLLRRAHLRAQDMKITVHVGGVLSSDVFYNDDPDWWKLWAEYGILGVEMETSALYSLAARYRVNALSILTVSDSLILHETAGAHQREQGFPVMAQLALQTVIQS